MSIEASGAGRREPLRLRALLIAALGVASVATMPLVPPIVQDPAYHEFADRRAFLGVPNFLDVVSNVPLGLVGIAGLAVLRRRSASFHSGWERLAFAVLFAGAVATAAGSTYYHLSPNDSTLFWDRLPMTVLFMSFFAATIGERIGMRAGRVFLGPLLAAGILSAVYWRMTGDLRPYVLVQFFPMLAIPLLLLLFPPLYTRSGDLVVALGWYALAKIFEVLDARIFAATGAVSGHTLKHLAAAAAIYWLYRAVTLRRPLA